MAVANPREVPEYELNPLELQIRKGDKISKVWSCSLNYQQIGDDFGNSHVVLFNQH